MNRFPQQTEVAKALITGGGCPKSYGTVSIAKGGNGFNRGYEKNKSTNPTIKDQAMLIPLNLEEMIPGDSDGKWMKSSTVLTRVYWMNNMRGEAQVHIIR